MEDWLMLLAVERRETKNGVDAQELTWEEAYDTALRGQSRCGILQLSFHFQKGFASIIVC